MRLIDADTIFNHELFFVKVECCDTVHEVIEKINNAPTVNAVEVVRCKDCKYYLNSNEKCGLIDTRLHFYETDKVWTEDCFCAWGERRIDETD